MFPPFESLQKGNVFEYDEDTMHVVKVTYYAGTRLIGSDYDIDMEIWEGDLFRITGFIPNSTQFEVSLFTQKEDPDSETTYVLEYSKVYEHAKIVVMSDEDQSTARGITVGRCLHLDHLTIDESKATLLDYMTKDELKDLRRLAMYGVRFTIFDMYEHSFDPKANPEEIVELVTSGSWHGIWRFPKKHLISLIKQWEI